MLLRVEVNRPLAEVILEGQPKAVRIASGQDRGTGRRTDRERRVAIGAAHALHGELVHIWRLDVPSTVAAHVTVAEVVGKNEDDVGGSSMKHSRRQEQQDGAEEESC